MLSEEVKSAIEAIEGHWKCCKNNHHGDSIVCAITNYGRILAERVRELEKLNESLESELEDAGNELVSTECQLASAEHVVDHVLKCGVPFARATEHREKYPKET